MQVISVDELVKYQGENVIIDSFEAAPMSVIEDIKTEIEQIATYGQIDDNTSFIRDGGMVKKLVLEIIDKHISGKEQTE